MNQSYSVREVRQRAAVSKPIAALIAMCMLFVGVGATHAQSKHTSAKQAQVNEWRQCLRTPLVHFDGTIVDAAVATDSLSTLVGAVSAAGLVDALSAPGRFTVFAPTNDAFGNLPTGILDALLADADALTNVLTYHVLPRAIDARRVFRTREFSALNSQDVFVRNRWNTGPKINNASFNCQGIVTSNGVVWIIDSVLQPEYR